MDVSSRILTELAQQEAALDAQIAQAHEAARREVEAAEAEAARILREAQERMKALQAEHDQRLTAETVNIREEARSQAAEGTQHARAVMGERVAQAAEHVLKAVLP